MKKFQKTILFVAIGSIAGYAYYHFVGCHGGCPITANPYISIAYGALAGLLLGYPSKKQE